MLWEQQDQQAYINFPQILTQTELVPYIIKNEQKHLQYRDFTSFNTTYFVQINVDHTFLVEHSETSDNRPFITSNISPETTPEEQTSNVQLQHTRQLSVQSKQEDIANLFKIQNLTNYTHYIHNYHKFPIYNKRILLKLLQYRMHQNFLKKLYKIHKILQ